MIRIGALTADDYDALAREAIEQAAKASKKGHYRQAAKLAGGAVSLWKQADLRRGGIQLASTC